MNERRHNVDSPMTNLAHRSNPLLLLEVRFVPSLLFCHSRRVGDFTKGMEIRRFDRSPCFVISLWYFTWVTPVDRWDRFATSRHRVTIYLYVIIFFSTWTIPTFATETRAIARYAKHKKQTSTPTYSCHCTVIVRARLYRSGFVEMYDTHVILINAGAAHKYAVYAKSELQLFHWPIFILVRSYI